MLITVKITISMIFSVINATGLIVAAIPSTNKILNTFEPITLPNAISTSFLRAATIEVTNSGKLVPNATTVKPITESGTPSALAIKVPLSTNKRAPIAIVTAPTAKKARCAKMQFCHL